MNEIKLYTGGFRSTETEDDVSFEISFDSTPGTFRGKSCERTRNFVSCLCECHSEVPESPEQYIITMRISAPEGTPFRALEDCLNREHGIRVIETSFVTRILGEAEDLTQQNNAMMSHCLAICKQAVKKNRGNTTSREGDPHES